MKVKELIAKVHLVSGQGIKIVDHAEKMTYWSKERYHFDHYSNDFERLLTLRVNSFAVDEFGLTIHAE